MLMGHSYLIAPSMSLRPLLALIAALAVAVVGRMAVDGYAVVLDRRAFAGYSG